MLKTDFPLLEGDPQTAPDAPNSGVLTESSAHKYFGDRQALGQALVIGDESRRFAGIYKPTFTLTGVVALGYSLINVAGLAIEAPDSYSPTP